MPEAHSKHSASNFEANALCPGRPAMSAGLPDRSSVYADEGTAAHELLTVAMQQGRPAAAYLGRAFKAGERTFTADQDMIDAVQTAIDAAHAVAGPGATFLLDRRVNYSRYLEVPESDAWGTLDITSVRGTELQVHDYKHGRGVEVSAGEDRSVGRKVERRPNMQMALYALGMLDDIDDVMGPFESVRLVIHQPRVRSAASEYVLSVAELKAWARSVAKPAVLSRLSAEATFRADDPEWIKTFLRPSEKACKFCKAKAICPALRAVATEQVFGVTPATADEFDDLTATADIKAAPGDWLSAAMGKADLIEDWIKAVRAEVESRLLAGEPVDGYKLVRGKAGSRDWIDADAAAEALKSLAIPLQSLYTQSLATPTAIGKLVKAGTITKEQFSAISEAHVRQAPGKPHVAPTSDNRPALVVKPVTDEFDDVS